VRKELAPAPEFDRQDLLNVRGAAKLSGLSKNFIYQRIGKPGGPPFVMRRNRIRLPREDFLIWSKQPIPPDRHSGIRAPPLFPRPTDAGGPADQ
jgi:hypothetical protein